MEGVASAGCNNLIVLLTTMLHDEIDLFLQTEKKKYSLLPGNPFHVHIVYLSQYFTFNNNSHSYQYLKYLLNHTDVDIEMTF